MSRHLHLVEPGSDGDVVGRCGWQEVIDTVSPLLNESRTDRSCSRALDWKTSTV